MDSAWTGDHSNARGRKRNTGQISAVMKRNEDREDREGGRLISFSNTLRFHFDFTSHSSFPRSPAVFHTARLPDPSTVFLTSVPAAGCRVKRRLYARISRECQANFPAKRSPFEIDRYEPGGKILRETCTNPAPSPFYYDPVINWTEDATSPLKFHTSYVFFPSLVFFF